VKRRKRLTRYEALDPVPNFENYTRSFMS
jgi:hypothetical protein